MDELTAFVRARLDDEEQWIRNYAHLLNEVHMDNADTVQHQMANVAFVFGQEHFHPDTLLREVAAKRRIVEDYRITAGACQRVTGPELDTVGYRAMRAGRDALRASCLALAAVWSDHPDYRTEWAV